MEDGLPVDEKPPREGDWNPFEVAMNKHFKYEIYGLDWCYKLIDMTTKEDHDELEF